MDSKLSKISSDVIIFCGGRGTRLSEKTHEMPKPLIELGEYPILWHIMKIYSHYSQIRFILTLGYKGEMISDFFLNQYPLLQNFSLNLSQPKSPPPRENWEIHFIQTGIKSKTAKRLLICKEMIITFPFLLTYGDGIADINIQNLIQRHQKLRREFGVIVTVTLTRPYSKYGVVKLRGELIEELNEKPLMNELINVGFMVLEKEIFEYISPYDDIMFEETLQKVAREGKLGYYIHEGFWHAMDTYKDYEDLNQMWRDDPKWKIWED